MGPGQHRAPARRRRPHGGTTRTGGLNITALPPPQLETVWSSRDAEGGRHFETFREAGAAVDPPGGDSEVVLALTTAKGLLVTGHGVDVRRIEAGDLALLVDVDPVKGVMLAAGAADPPAWAGVLWMVLRHRQDAQAACMIVPREAPGAARSAGGGSLRGHGASSARGWGFDEGGVDDLVARSTGGLVEWATRALGSLQSGSVATLPGHVIAVGPRLEDAVRVANKHHDHPRR